MGLALASVLAGACTTAATWPAPPAPVAAEAPLPVVAGEDERAGVVTSQPVDAGRPAPPAAVAVPSLGVASHLIELGLHADRTLQVPADPAVAGWYVGASRPGETGPVVVVGHVDSRRGPGVFARLGELVPGSRVELALADGAVAAYEVTGSRRVAKDAFPTEEVYGAVPRDELRLITCGGNFDRGAGSYRDNLVVSAVRV